MILNKLWLLVRDYQGTAGCQVRRLNYNRTRHHLCRCINTDVELRGVFNEMKLNILTPYDTCI